jgi:acyl-CoA thioesterase I
MHMTKQLLTSFYILFLVNACGNEVALPKLGADAVILAFGDSLTQGKGAKSEQSYPAVLSRLINRKVINAGVSGEESLAGLKRLPALLDQHQPDLLILCHGGNDFLRKKDAGKMEENVREMIRLAKSANIPVVLLGVPKPGLFLSSADVYAKIAKTTDVVFIEELIAEVLSDKSLKSDTVHPNSEGYRIMAESINSVLSKKGVL